MWYDIGMAKNTDAKKKKEEERRQKRLAQLEKHAVVCPHCGGKALDHMTKCPHCGGELVPTNYNRTLSEKARRRLKTAGFILGLVATVVVILVIFLGK